MAEQKPFPPLPPHVEDLGQHVATQWHRTVVMEILYWHEASRETEFVKKAYSLRTWKVYARAHADQCGELMLVRNGRTLRAAVCEHFGTKDNKAIWIYREWKV